MCYSFKILVLFLLLHTSTFPLRCQTKYEIGLGLVKNDYPIDRQIFYLTDTVFISKLGWFLQPSGLLEAPQDPRTSFFFKYSLLTKKIISIRSSLFFSKRFASVDLHRIHRQPGIRPFGVSPFTKSFTFFVPVSVTLHPISLFSLDAGIGPAFHFNSTSGTFPLFVDFEERDYFFEEAYREIPETHKKVTWNYTISGSLNLFNSGLALSVYRQGSFGRINNQLKLSGKEYDFSMRWRSMSLLLSYNFNIK